MVAVEATRLTEDASPTSWPRVRSLFNPTYTTTDGCLRMGCHLLLSGEFGFYKREGLVMHDISPERAARCNMTNSKAQDGRWKMDKSGLSLSRQKDVKKLCPRFKREQSIAVPRARRSNPEVCPRTHFVLDCRTNRIVSALICRCTGLTTSSRATAKPSKTRLVQSRRTQATSGLTNAEKSSVCFFKRPPRRTNNTTASMTRTSSICSTASLRRFCLQWG